MKTNIISIFTRTPLHIGAGSSVGAIDQPIIRERHTGFPTIPGSAVKGVIADLFLNEKRELSEEGLSILGSAKGNVGQSGTVSFGEGKLLAFPVRSAKGCFAWVTSPMTVCRWLRDSGVTCELPEVKDNAVYAAEALMLSDNKVLLEGYLLNADKMPAGLVEALLKACDDPMWQELLPEHLLLASDELLSHFCTASCEIAQHVCIDDETGTAKDGALFNQENVPAETLFYAPLSELRTINKGQSPLDVLQAKLPPVLQFGADATTGLGFCTVSMSTSILA